ncbi:MAG TPA: cation transporting ATPase C-terminal domain-containing protein [Chloroflexota bacterium]|nr:cation transporting ATPase C-terminal domain-containing protein [Chloroflexota bacterium]
MDSDRTATPQRWTMHLVRDFMLVFGPISSLFDDATFGAHWFIFRAQPDLFRTGWFVESLATQTLVIYVIRTARAPWRSRPSRALVLSTVVALTVDVVLPLTPMAGHRSRLRRAIHGVLSVPCRHRRDLSRPRGDRQALVLSRTRAVTRAGRRGLRWRAMIDRSADLLGWQEVGAARMGAEEEAVFRPCLPAPTDRAMPRRHAVGIAGERRSAPVCRPRRRRNQ